jgi:formate hydrogenlyase transcriptional activator
MSGNDTNAREAPLIPPAGGPAADGTAPPKGEDELSVLRALVQGTARGTGEAFFRSLVRHLADAVGVKYAFAAEFSGDMRARTLAYWKSDRIVPNVEWDLRGTPCEDVVRGELCHHPSGVCRQFPDDEPMVRMGVESYLGVPLLDAGGRHLGHLAVFDGRPMPPEPRKLFTFRVFAARAAAELERLRMEQMLREGERRYRELYEEAPIAYVYEDTQSRFVHANRAAVRLLGLNPEEVAGTLGTSLLAPHPGQRERIREALEAMKSQGKEFAGVELELRRRDDGRPVWVQWWSRPDPDGRHTRTMLVDVTARVLAERERARLEQQNVYLQEEIKSAHNFEEIVGRSRALLGVLENVRQVAPTDASVLITGETGTGKELIARAVHSASRRRDKPLIKVNCAALPSGLVESELFGHEKGAFSGAIARRTGRFELAHGGTIFLDEVGEIPPDVQVKLLRVLQEHEFERVGGGTPIKADVRVIAATNRDLRRAVREGKFREDLFYRLNVFPVHLPPLRERPDDVPLLVEFLIARFAARLGKRVEGVGPGMMDRLTRYRWPGNVRELENLVERAVILAAGPLLDIDPDGGSGGGGAGMPAEGAMKNAPEVPASVGLPNAAVAATLVSVERAHLLAVLGQTNWVIEGPRGAATVLGLHPNTLRSRLKRLGLTRASAATAGGGHEPS